MLNKQQVQIKTQCLNTPKLRTFVKFKDFFRTPTFLTKPLSFIQRKFLAKIRLGCLELRIETGRYARPRQPPESRLCQVCNEQDIEDEFHFLFECKVYEEERFLWLSKLKFADNFLQQSPEAKFNLVLNEHNNVKHTAQFLISIFDSRTKIVTKLPSLDYATSTNNLFHSSPQDQCPACAFINAQ